MGDPLDSYGMPYKIPVDMAALEFATDFPVFTGTPHLYGNQKWGGLEWLHTVGATPDMFSMYNYVDYDPVTGSLLRRAIRQQINLRVERGPLLPNIIASQQRCIAPTMAFSGASGYGCFAYIPLYWYEDARIQTEKDFFVNVDHYYNRPARAVAALKYGAALGVVLIIIGCCLLAYEAYHRRRFNQRVYID